MEQVRGGAVAICDCSLGGFATANRRLRCARSFVIYFYRFDFDVVYSYFDGRGSFRYTRSQKKSRPCRAVSFGAGDGSRTHLQSLGSFYSTDELHLHIRFIFAFGADGYGFCRSRLNRDYDRYYTTAAGKSQSFLRGVKRGGLRNIAVCVGFYEIFTFRWRRGVDIVGGIGV